MAPADVTLAIALKLLTLPRDLGLHPESGKKVVANVGRFGPYLQHDGEFRSVPKTEDVYTIELPRAVEILAQPKSSARGSLRTIGQHPEDGAAITLHTGRYGNYVKHGKINATLTEGMDLDTLTLDEALALLSARVAATGKKPAKAKTTLKKATSTKKPTATKKTSPKSKVDPDSASKPTKGSAKKSTTVKSPAKKALAKKTSKTVKPV